MVRLPAVVEEVQRRAVDAEVDLVPDRDVPYTDVGDKGLEALAGLTKLRQLSLDSTTVTDASARFLQGFPQLRKLNLYHTFVTNQGNQKVREALPQCEIIFDPKSSDPKRRRS